MRPLAYQDANVFLLCFNIGDPESLDGAINKVCVSVSNIRKTENCADHEQNHELYAFRHVNGNAMRDSSTVCPLYVVVNYDHAHPLKGRHENVI